MLTVFESELHVVCRALRSAVSFVTGREDVVAVFLIPVDQLLRALSAGRGVALAPDGRLGGCEGDFALCVQDSASVPSHIDVRLAAMLGNPVRIRIIRLC